MQNCFYYYFSFPPEHLTKKISVGGKDYGNGYEPAHPGYHTNIIIDPYAKVYIYFHICLLIRLISAGFKPVLSKTEILSIVLLTISLARPFGLSQPIKQDIIL